MPELNLYRVKDSRGITLYHGTSLPAAYKEATGYTGTTSTVDGAPIEFLVRP